jgi:hypothetical protein
LVGRQPVTSHMLFEKHTQEQRRINEAVLN